MTQPAPGFIAAGIYASLPDFSFDTIRFPVKDVELKCGSRIKMHKFPHVDAGLLEKLGRDPVEVSATIMAHASFTKWPGLFSDTLPALRQRNFDQKTANLVVPHFGAFQALITSWSETTRGVSGVEVKVTWTEDLSELFRLAALTERYIRAVSTSGKQFAVSLPSMEQSMTPQEYNVDLGDGRKAKDVFETMRGIVLAIDSIGDQSKLYSSFYLSKLQELEGLCGLVDRAFPPYNDPNHVRDLEILHELWSDTITARKNAYAKLPEIDTYVVPRTMTCSELARELYHDASRGSDVLGLNPKIQDPYRVTLGTEVRYFRAAA